MDYLSKIVFGATLGLCGFQVFAHKCEQSDTAYWNQSPEYQRVENQLGQLFKCVDTSDPNEYTLRDRTACNWFVGRAMEVIYNNNAFKSGDGYLTANQIAKSLTENSIAGWEKIGAANNLDDLTLAGSKAELGNAVIAAWANDAGHGHVSLIMPGGLAHSGGWGLDVPNSANMSVDDISRAYIGCRLSWGFSSSKKDRVFLYSNN